MAHDAHSQDTTPVPANLLARHQDGWKHFTKAIVINCAAIAALLIVLLLIFRVF